MILADMIQATETGRAVHRDEFDETPLTTDISESSLKKVDIYHVSVLDLTFRQTVQWHPNVDGSTLPDKRREMIASLKRNLYKGFEEKVRDALVFAVRGNRQGVVDSIHAIMNEINDQNDVEYLLNVLRGRG